MARVICEICGSEVDTETGEAFFKKGTNAFSMKTLKDEKVQLQYDLKNIKEQYDILLEKFNELTGGKTDDEDGSDKVGEQYRSFKFAFEE